jgi:hypothetical protein
MEEIIHELKYLVNLARYLPLEITDISILLPDGTLIIIK